MKIFKKIIAAVCAVAVALSVAGCADVSTMGSINGTEIKAGVYLWYELAAIQEANTEVEEQLSEMGTSSSKIENFSYFNYNVQEKPYSQYVEERTLEFIKQYVAVQKKFEEMGLTLTDEEKAEVKTSAKDFWASEMTYYGYYPLGITYGEQYESLGVSRQSYESVMMVRKMYNKIFDAYYDKNGVTATDEKDIETYFNDNYGRFQVIQVSLTDGYGDTIESDEGKAEIKALADGYLERIKSGEDYDAVYHDYEEYVAEQKAKAEAEKAAADTSSDASADPSASDESSTDTASSDDTSSDTSDDTTSSGSEEAEEEEHDHEFLIAKSDTSPSEELIKWMFELKENDGGVYEDKTVYYVVVRRPLLEREDWYLENRLDILHEMKDEEFEEVLNEIAKDYPMDLSQASLDMYKPEKIKQ